MATYLAVPVKRTWEIDYVKPLKAFIVNTFTSINPDEYGPALSELNKLRNTVISKSGDKHESALEVIYRYYDQLTANEAKFPIAENYIRVEFKWQDAFDKESFFSGKRTLSIASSTYEQGSILFNIGAMQSQVAGAQNTTSDDGLKNAAKLFQQAAGIFTFLRELVIANYRNDLTPDMNPDTLNALIALMLAQAQDCICRKAMLDMMKPAVIAKLANQGSELYADALKQLQIASIRDLWNRDWILSVAGKQAAYHGIAEYYMSITAKETKDFGVEIARLRHAKDLMSASETRGGSTFIFSKQMATIKKALEDANKDNEFIYHAKVPDQSALPAIGKAAIAKVTPFSTPLSSNFKDLFEKVVPLAVHQALGSFENRKTEIANAEIHRLRDKTQFLNSVLASLNLPAAIEDLSGATVPTSLLEKAAKCREAGGITMLNKLMSELPELLTRNKEIHDESVKMLDEEENSDRQLRAQFTERWTRTPSEKLTGPIRSEGQKYGTILTNAISADHIVKERYAAHIGNIALLSKSDAEIQKALPASSPVAALQGSTTVQRLRQLMENVEAIKAEREVVENELKNVNLDMSAQFMSALAADGAITEEDLAVSELNSAFEPLRMQVTESCDRQEALLAEIQAANDAFCREKNQGQTGATRDQKLKDMAAAFDNFTELCSNLREGTKFYNDLTQLLVKFQNKVTDFCFARKTEKDELMKDLQTTIANRPTIAAPAAPAYHQPTGFKKAQKEKEKKERKELKKLNKETTPPAAPSTTTSSGGEGPRKPPARPPPPTRRAAPSAAQAQAQAPAQPGAPVQPQSMPQPYDYSQYAAPVPQGYQQPAAGYQGYRATAPLPYPMAPMGGYAPPPMPAGYNPIMQYAYPVQGQTYPQQTAYPGYPGYPQQGYR